MQDFERWRELHEKRVESVEDRMDRHEVQCAERYKALADTLNAAGKSREELHTDIRELRSAWERNHRIMLVALVLIAFAAVFQESTILEFVRLGARAVFGASPTE